MSQPTATTPNTSETGQLLYQYFSQYAESGIKQMKTALIAIGFYERVKWRLERGEDLSDEVDGIAKIGNEAALQVVAEAIEQNRALIRDCWTLPQALLNAGNLEVTQEMRYTENLPRTDIYFTFKCAAGLLVVKISTTGENYKIQVTSDLAQMPKSVCVMELERVLMMASLSI